MGIVYMLHMHAHICTHPHEAPYRLYTWEHTHTHTCAHKHTYTEGEGERGGDGERDQLLKCFNSRIKIAKIYMVVRTFNQH